ARAAHARTGVGAEGAERDDRAGERAQPGRIAGAPRDGDQPAAEPRARLVARVAVDEDLAAAHARALAGVRGAEPATGRAAHDEPPAAHPDARGVARVALDDDVAAGHLGAGVRSRVAGDSQPAAGHAGPEARDATEVALDAHVVAHAAGHGEQVADGRPPVAVPELEPLDLGRAQPGEPVGGERLGADRRG